MRIAVGSDHAGYELKVKMTAYVRELGHAVVDVGTDNSEVSVDYPDYAEAVGVALHEDRADRGIVICGSGVGASVAANKLPGIRAGLCHDTYSAHQGVEHDEMNVLVMGARVIGLELARELVSVFIKAEFASEERYCRRLTKLRALEVKYSTRAKRLGRSSFLAFLNKLRGISLLSQFLGGYMLTCNYRESPNIALVFVQRLCYLCWHVHRHGAQPRITPGHPPA